MDRRDAVYKITEIIFKHLGDSAKPELVKQIVRELINTVPLGVDGTSAPVSPSVEPEGQTAIITAFGKSHPGIVAGITGILAEKNVDITDITQTLLGKNFAMIVIVNLAEANCSFSELKETLTKKGDELGVGVFSQHEELFQFMHKV
ncbi:MAG: ACT domain-containing protein [Acidobacteria bacterium]|nr:ACT domain-containing protein [Acidobacteriota bacterium]